ncbi:MAG TPA: hypothetical protein V6D03_00605, partial [Candidatus Caenarcaniphilales bacterium]
MGVALRKIPWLSLGLLGLTYALLGWDLSTYDVLWTVWFLIAAVAFTAVLTWNSKLVARVVRLGPQSVVLIFIFTLVACLAATFGSLVTLSFLLLATQVLAKLELQLSGFKRSHTLWILMVTAGAAVVIGWILGTV